MTAYIKHDNPGVEPPVPGEEEKTTELISLINQVQQKNFSEHRHGFRGTHVKTQGIVKGTLTVLDSLPDHLRQGLFKESGKTFPVAARYANEPSKLQDDKAPGPRGLSIKVFNTPSDATYLSEEGTSTRTHDFTFNNAPIIELRDVHTCASIIATRLANWSDPDALKAALEQRKDKDLQFAPAGLPNTHLLGMTMHSQAAYRFGDYVCKFALVPVAGLEELASSHPVTDDSEPDQHARWLSSFFASNEARYEFRVQLARDLSRQPVEDAAVQWEEQDAPFETVARVVFDRGQDPMDARRRAVWDDRVRLNPWYGLAEHRPLGSINRLRRRLYMGSAVKRGELNGTEVGLLRRIEDLP